MVNVLIVKKKKNKYRKIKIFMKNKFLSIYFPFLWRQISILVFKR